MKINNIDVVFNILDTTERQNFNDAFVEISYKAKKLEDRLENSLISQQEYQKKQIKLIKKFLKTILPTEKSQPLIKTCFSYEDYYKVFESITQMVCTTISSINSIMQSRKKIDKWTY